MNATEDHRAMDIAQGNEWPVSKLLTWDEIRERYPDQWVCLAEIGWLKDTDFAFTTARVVGHGKTSREPLDQARPLRDRYDEIGHFFTGTIAPPWPFNPRWLVEPMA